MSEPARRKELRARYEQTRPEAGVYVIRNQRTNRALLGSTLDLASVGNKLAFAQSTNTPSALDHRLGKDIRQFGIDAFALEVLEVLEITPEMTPAGIRADLAALEELWRERLGAAELYGARAERPRDPRRPVFRGRGSQVSGGLRGIPTSQWCPNGSTMRPRRQP